MNVDGWIGVIGWDGCMRWWIDGKVAHHPADDLL